MDLKPDGYFLPGFWQHNFNLPLAFTSFILIKKTQKESTVLFFEYLEIGQYKKKFANQVQKTFSNRLLHFSK